MRTKRTRRKRTRRMRTKRTMRKRRRMRTKRTRRKRRRRKKRRRKREFKTKGNEISLVFNIWSDLHTKKAAYQIDTMKPLSRLHRIIQKQIRWSLHGSSIVLAVFSGRKWEA